jgi:ribonuclease D
LSLRLDKFDRLDWAREEFDRLRDSVVPPEARPSLAERWRKLRGVGTLDRRQLAVVRELHRWREEQAARSNRPSRTILRDDLLIEIARRNPRGARDLQVVRGLPKKSLDDIVQAVRLARELPAAEWPEPAEQDQDPNQVGLVVHILTAVLGDLCAKEKLATNLVASNQDLKLLARARYRGEEPPRTCLLTQGWRAQHMLPHLEAVLHGRRLIRIDDVRADGPLALEG